MKKTLIALLVLFIGFNAYAQEQPEKTDAEKRKAARMVELMGKKIDMKVNPDLFMQATTNTYVSEEPKAVIMAMLVPETYADSKMKMKKNVSKEFKVTNQGEKTMNGVKVLFMEGTSEAQGTKLNNVIYCMQVDAETCLMFIGMVESGADKKYDAAITSAANSVIKSK